MRSGIAAWVLGGLSACGSGEPEQAGSTMILRRVIAEPLAEDPAFRILQQRQDVAPSIRVLSPSRDTRVRGADLLSLVLPPPAAVELALRGSPDQVLDLCAGLDQAAMEAYAKEFQGCAIEFELELGERSFRERLAFESVGQSPGSEWIEHEGIPLDGAHFLILRTRFVDAAGEYSSPTVPLPAGFGGLKLVLPETRPRTRSSPQEPNIVLFVMDTQRADRLSAYGYERPTAPRLAELAQRGTLFERAYSTSNWTWPSTASILTGLPPEEHGLVDLNSCFLSERLQTLAEVLQEQGFTTAGWSANYLIASDKNFDQGFESFIHAKGASQRSDQVLPQVSHWLEAVAGQRFFLYVHLLDPHAPLEPMEEGRLQFAAQVPRDFSATAVNDFRWCLLRNGGHTDDGERATEQCVSSQEQAWIRDLYDACTWSGDQQLGRLIDRIDELGLLDETLFAYTSDHGEELFEHGLLTHGQSLHPELVHVPLVLAGPGIQSGVRVREQVSNRMLASTLAELGGTRMQQVSDARNLLRSGNSEPVLYSTNCGWWNGKNWLSILGLRTEQRVLHLAPRGASWGAVPNPAGDWRLYDPQADPGETHDLSQAEPETLARMRAYLQTELAARKARRSTPSIQAGATTRARLSALGYSDN